MHEVLSFIHWVILGAIMAAMSLAKAFSKSMRGKKLSIWKDDEP